MMHRCTGHRYCQPSPVRAPPTGADWLPEIKHDGFCLMVRRAGARVRLFTRNGHDWDARYPAIVTDGGAAYALVSDQRRGNRLSMRERLER